MARQPGFMGVQIAADTAKPDLIYIVINIQSRDYLNRFMSKEHDVLARETRCGASSTGWGGMSVFNGEIYEPAVVLENLGLPRCTNSSWPSAQTRSRAQSGYALN